VLPPEGEARDQRDAAERHEQEEDPVERGHQLVPERLEFDVAVVSGMLRRSRSVCHRLNPFPDQGVRGAEQSAHAHYGRRNGAERRLVKAGKGFSLYVGKPSFSNGTADRYTMLVPPKLLLSVDVLDAFNGKPLSDDAGKRFAASIATPACVKACPAECLKKKGMEVLRP
jgi:hypothetical protein